MKNLILKSMLKNNKHAYRCTTKCMPPLLLFITLLYTQLLSGQIFLNQGDEFQNVIDNNPNETHFIIKAGEHRMQMITARDNLIIEGETGPNGELLSTMKGSEELTGFTPVTIAGKQYWRKQNVINQNTSSQIGKCLDNLNCHRTEDIFINRVPLTKVALRDLLDQPSECYIEDDDVYLSFNPTGKLVEASVMKFAIHGKLAPSGGTKGASNVTVRNLIVEQYANPAQHGAINAGFNSQFYESPKMGFDWVIENNEVRYNHGVGIYVHTGGLMKNNYIHNNGQLGMRAAGDNVVIDGNESAYNGEWAGYKWTWEGGGSKFVHSSNLKVVNNYCHNNNGAGLWTDNGNIDTTIENNRCEDNAGPGIFHEVSYDATIKCNIASNNQWDIPNSNAPEFYGANIFISTSSNVKVYDNITISNGLQRGNGIIVLCEDRDTDNRISDNNQVYNNTITYTTAANYSGIYTVFDCRGGSGNLFTNNQYHAVDPNHEHFIWAGQSYTGDFNAMQNEGQDLGSTMDSQISGLACDDYDACTENDVYVSACNCAGTFIDADENGICDLEECADLIINNYEDQTIGDWYSYASGDSYSRTNLSYVPQSGTYAMYDTCHVEWVNGYQQAGIRNDLNSVAKDWSGYLGLSFGFKGTNTGNKIYIELTDNGGEKFAYWFEDVTRNWKTFDLYWDDFFRRGGQPSGIPNDGMTLTDMQSIKIHIMTSGAYPQTISQYFRIDNVQLICDPNATNITINAKGDEGAELMTLQINGENVGEWTVSTNWEDYQYQHTGTIDQLKVYLSNHQYVQGSIDYNLNIDYVTVGQTTIQTNAPQTYGTAVKIDGQYCSTGFNFQKEKLFCKGYIQYIGAIPNNKMAASETGLMIYPNPANDYVQFDFPDTDEIKSVHIYDLNGTFYKNQLKLKDNKIQVQHLAKGIYWLQVGLQDGTTIHEKFIKN